MNTNQSDLNFEDIQVYRDEYIRQMDQHVDKTEFAKNNADSL